MSVTLKLFLFCILAAITNAAERGKSPSGELMFACDKSPDDVDRAAVYIWEPTKPQTRKIIFDAGPLRVYDVKFSPNEEFVAIESGGGSAGHDVTILRKKASLQWDQIVPAPAGSHAECGSCGSLAEQVVKDALESTDNGDVFEAIDHSYLKAIRWLDDSKTLELEVQAKGENSQENYIRSVLLEHWRCLYDVERAEFVSDPANRGVVTVKTSCERPLGKS